MNDKRLQIYLDDHAALISGEIDLCVRCRDSNHVGPLTDFLTELKDALESQEGDARVLLTRLGGSASLWKQGAAWLAEKLGRFKLNDTLLQYTHLSLVVELEALASLGYERLALWDTLESIAGEEPRLQAFDISKRKRETEAQLMRLDEFRREAAGKAFLTDEGAE